MKSITNLMVKFTSNRQVRPTLCFMLFFGFLFIAACSKDDAKITPDVTPVSEPEPVPDPVPTTLTFAEVIASGDDFEPFPESRTEETISVSEQEIEDSQLDEDAVRWLCTDRTVSLTDGSGEFSLFNPNAGVIYPGSLVQGKTLSDASPSPIVVARAGGSISYDLNDGNLMSSIVVDEVKKSTIQAAMNQIISGAVGIVPANFQLDIIQIESESQLALEMGLSVETFATKADANMSFNTAEEVNSTLVKMNQAYYTMSFDLPTSNDQIFGANVTPEDLATYVQPDNPATFISKVTYGRIFYMLIESTSSRQQMEANINLAYDGFAASAEGNLKVSLIEALKNVNIKVIAYGGDAVGAIDLAGEPDIATIATALGNSTNIAAGLPISYEARSVARPDQVVGTALTTEYTVRECELKGILPPDTYLPLVDLFEDGFGAALQISGSNIILYNKAGDKYAYYNVAAANIIGIYDTTDVTGPMGFSGVGFAMPYSQVGAATIRIDLLGLPNPSTLSFLFNNNGISLTAFFMNNPGQQNSLPPLNGPFRSLGNYLSPNPVSDVFGSSQTTYPFAGDGIDAALYVKKEGDTENIDFFSNNGTEWSTLRSGNGDFWDEPQKTDNWRGQKLFDKVGAACRVQFGNTDRYLFFNMEGDEMMISNGTEILGSYVVN